MEVQFLRETDAAARRAVELIEHVERTIIQADHSKIGRRAMCHLAGLERIDVLSTASRFVTS